MLSQIIQVRFVIYVCKATPKNMNKLDLVCNRSLDKATLTFDISPLYCWIRCFECLLYISYRIDIKQWRIISKTDKKSKKSERNYSIKIQDTNGTNCGYSKTRKRHNPKSTSTSYVRTSDIHVGHCIHPSDVYITCLQLLWTSIRCPLVDEIMDLK